jgi:uncharacterized protein YgiM (DUF1202 family)
VLAIGKKQAIVIGGIAVAIILLAWMALSMLKDTDTLALQHQEDKIRDIDDRLARIEQQLDGSRKPIAPSEAEPDEAARPDRSAKQTLNNPRREEPRLANRNAPPPTRFYQTVRSTFVFEEPTASSRKVGSIPDGTKVRVVGSTGDWLEVRSKQGRAPGFIRQDDAVLMR